MADPLKHLELALDLELEAIKRELMNMGANKLIDVPPGKSLGTVHATIGVDFDAILRSTSSSRVVREVPQEEGSEDNPSTEVG